MDDLSLHSVVFRIARLEEIVGLREAVLIRGTDRDTPYFEGDRDETTLHFGAFLENRVLGCLSFMQHEWMGNPAWQLRGMATDPDFRDAGVGTRLLAQAEAALAKRSDIRQFWCNARSAAVGFYRKQGWTVVSDEFQIPGVGPHYKMTKTLAKVI